ncbi:3-carboxy-cis,cis-muconate cycloisomerase [Streptomyces sp. NBC_01016]|uniref:3-carboxy-cis,cis-muconate cycloisomerase n=1 Tax=Streptomyces sp. NBC_01016 TaxID=2903720 RepID=UPI002258A70C|nr:3-carboxy-cis,cis-muconate cycloisomerase [Streptomyces sp. NBC_01016]MCX4830634.1 3-carboxy-cis,cis-muconate cycloisomerase [Streptomyces sp. NBC_01016]
MTLFDPGSEGAPTERTTSEEAFLQALLDAEAGLTRAQSSLDLAPVAAGGAVTAAAVAERFDVRDLARRSRGGGNPVIPLVADLTAAVVAEDKQYAEYVHRGATSQDILDSALMLVAARTLDVLLDELSGTEGALAGLAREHRDTAMPGRTLTQHAVPTTFGLKAAGWRSLVLDARDRLRSVRGALPVQLGGAAGTLAAFGAYGSEDPLALVAAYARELGLAEPELPWHVLRTPVGDLAGALAFTAGALGKIAADVLVLSRTEIGELAEGAGGGSSAMPHKANPVRSALVAAAARRAPALAATLYASVAAEDERPSGAWHAEWATLRELLRVVGGAARDASALVGGLVVRVDVMHAHLSLTGGAIVSERLSAELAGVLGRGVAKELLASASRRARESGLPLADVLSAEPALKDSGMDVAELTDPSRYTGAAGALVDRALGRR